LPATPVIAFAGSVAVAAFPVGSPLLRLSWLDPPSILAGSRLPDWIRRCRGLPDRIRHSPSIPLRARTLWPAQTRALLSASLAGLLDVRPIEEARRADLLVLFCCVALADRWRSNVDSSRRIGFCCVSPDRDHLDFGYLGI
jgi:hypothetical protein